ncbi:glycosyltransferase [Sutcliffiella halmapala]|uniref:glycosyltransferase n=1 Tax=Sutcliffiella halmapala TaxID=79882 RepID=UPI00099503B0|nr:glycosyltransferase [Sutcliffiella halmapala]
MDIIIYPPTIDWTFMKQRPQHLMKQFADQGYLVFYCNQTSQQMEIEEISPNLFLVHDHDKWLNMTLPTLRKKNNSKVGIWCTWPQLVDSLHQYEADWIIYDCVDEFPRMLAFERKMIDASTAIVCTAERIFSRLRRKYPEKKIKLIRNAYDKDMGLHLQKNNRSISHKQKKSIGYIGAWAPWIDDRLISRIATKMKDVEIVIIGTEFGKKFNLNNPNVTFLGHLPHKDLAEYLTSFSACLIPFRINPITRATNPVKMYEYLATGKPVISTNLPECSLVHQHVDIANSHVEFMEKLSYRLHDPGNLQNRINFALQNTWEHRITDAISLIREIT